MRLPVEVKKRLEHWWLLIAVGRRRSSGRRHVQYDVRRTSCHLLRDGISRSGGARRGHGAVSGRRNIALDRAARRAGAAVPSVLGNVASQQLSAKVHKVARGSRKCGGNAEARYEWSGRSRRGRRSGRKLQDGAESSSRCAHPVLGAPVLAGRRARRVILDRETARNGDCPRLPPLSLLSMTLSRQSKQQC